MDQGFTEGTGFWLRAGIPVAAALLGGVLGTFTAKGDASRSNPLVHFCGGAFLCVALFHLLPEAAMHLGWGAAVASAAAGSGLTALLGRWAGGHCPSCDGEPDPSLHLRLGLPLFLVLGVHSGVDGFALAGHGVTEHSHRVIEAAVLLHKLPEGLAIATLSRANGGSPARSLGLTALIESCTFAGLGLGAAFAVGGPLLPLTLSVVAGSILYLAAVIVNRLRSSIKPVRGCLLVSAGVAFVLLGRWF